MARVLIAEYSPYTEALACDLRAREHEILTVTTATAARSAYDTYNPDVVLLGAQLVGTDGLVAVQDLVGHGVPLVFVSRVPDSADRTVALKLGADDAVSLPMDAALLSARIDALVRRYATPLPPGPETVELGQITVRLLSREVYVGESRVHLTRTEHLLLVRLMTGAVVTREDLSIAAWGDPNADHTIDVHISRIRRKLTLAGLTNPRLVNVRGIGYRLIPAQEVPA